MDPYLLFRLVAESGCFIPPSQGVFCDWTARSVVSKNDLFYPPSHLNLQMCHNVDPDKLALSSRLFRKCDSVTSESVVVLNGWVWKCGELSFPSFDTVALNHSCPGTFVKIGAHVLHSGSDRGLGSTRQINLMGFLGHLKPILKIQPTDQRVVWLARLPGLEHVLCSETYLRSAGEGRTSSRWLRNEVVKRLRNKIMSKSNWQK